MADKAGTHHTPNPHDAEEQLRPYLGQLHDATELRTAGGWEPSREAVAAMAALTVALQQLGVSY